MSDHAAQGDDAGGMHELPHDELDRVTGGSSAKGHPIVWHTDSQPVARYHMD